jgi:hypothetical protein
MDVYVPEVHHDHHGYDAAVAHTDGRLLVVTYDDELHRPGGILIVDPPPQPPNGVRGRGSSSDRPG